MSKPGAKVTVTGMAQVVGVHQPAAAPGEQPQRHMVLQLTHLALAGDGVAEERTESPAELRGPATGPACLTAGAGRGGASKLYGSAKQA